MKCCVCGPWFYKLECFSLALKIQANLIFLSKAVAFRPYPAANIRFGVDNPKKFRVNFLTHFPGAIQNTYYVYALLHKLA